MLLIGHVQLGRVCSNSSPSALTLCLNFSLVTDLGSGLDPYTYELTWDQG